MKNKWLCKDLFAKLGFLWCRMLFLFFGCCINSHDDCCRTTYIVCKEFCVILKPVSLYMNKNSSRRKVVLRWYLYQQWDVEVIYMGHRASLTIVIYSPQYLCPLQTWRAIPCQFYMSWIIHLWPFHVVTVTWFPVIPAHNQVFLMCCFLPLPPARDYPVCSCPSSWPPFWITAVS